MNVSKSLAGLFGIHKAMDGASGVTITIGIILLICFISGVLLRGALVSKLKNSLEVFLDNRYPGMDFTS